MSRICFIIIFCYTCRIYVPHEISIRCLCAKGTNVFSQPPNWDLTADVMAGSWKETKTKIGSDKEVLVFQSYRRERNLFECLPGNFLFFYEYGESMSYSPSSSFKKKHKTQTGASIRHVNRPQSHKSSSDSWPQPFLKKRLKEKHPQNF